MGVWMFVGKHWIPIHKRMPDSSSGTCGGPWHVHDETSARASARSHSSRSCRGLEAVENGGVETGTKRTMGTVTFDPCRRAASSEAREDEPPDARANGRIPRPRFDLAGEAEGPAVVLRRHVRADGQTQIAGPIRRREKPRVVPDHKRLAKNHLLASAGGFSFPSTSRHGWPGLIASSESSPPRPG